VVEPGYLPVALPKLNVVTVDELFCRLNRRFVIGAINANRPDEISKRANHVNSIFRHLRPPER
jgi:hypothetical protein